MAIGDVLSGDKVKLWIEDAGTIGVDLPVEGGFQSEATNFNVNGGEIDYDSEAVFGGFIDVKKPQAQYEISLDVILRFGTDVNKWDLLKSAGSAKMIALEARDGDGNFYWNAFNNARVINFDKEFEAEGEWRGTVTFKLSATDADGNINEQVTTDGTKGVADATDGVIAWS